MCRHRPKREAHKASRSGKLDLKVPGTGVLTLMKREYKVKWDPPADYDPSSVLRKLPSPIAPGPREIYNYFVQPDGFYFVDRLVDPAIAGLAFKMFVDEALEYASEVSIVELKQERAVESEDPGGRTSMKFQDVELAFEFVNAGQPMEHTAYVFEIDRRGVLAVRSSRRR